MKNGLLMLCLMVVVCMGWLSLSPTKVYAACSDSPG